MQIAFNQFVCAVMVDTKGTGGIVDTGYVNRHTGDLLLIPITETDGVKFGWTLAHIVNSVFERAEVEANPEDWIAVERVVCDTPDDVEAEFYAFCERHGLDATLIG